MRFRGANRSCPVVNFSPVKQVNIKGRWYYERAGELIDQLELEIADLMERGAAADVDGEDAPRRCRKLRLGSGRLWDLGEIDMAGR